MNHLDYSAHCSCKECTAFTWQEIRDALIVGALMAVGTLIVWGMVP